MRRGPAKWRAHFLAELRDLLRLFLAAIELNNHSHVHNL
jgi:hypothetical protein